MSGVIHHVELALGQLNSSVCDVKIINISAKIIASLFLVLAKLISLTLKSNNAKNVKLVALIVILLNFVIYVLLDIFYTKDGAIINVLRTCFPH